MVKVDFSKIEDNTGFAAKSILECYETFCVEIAAHVSRCNSNKMCKGANSILEKSLDSLKDHLVAGKRAKSPIVASA